MKIYACLSDLIGFEIVPALGEWVTSFDVDAIAREVTEWRDTGYVVAVTVDEFWEIVARHEV